MRLLLQRYLAANFILPLVVSLVFFVAFLLTFELFRLTALLMSRDISVLFLASLMGNLALTFIPLALPLSTFFSVIFCLNKLSTDSEYIAMRAAGLSKFRLFVPFLVVSMVLATSVFFLSQQVIPYTNRDFKRQVNFLTSSGLLGSIKSGQFFTAIPSLTMFPATVSTDGRLLGDVFLHVKDNDEERVIQARRGELLYDRDSKTLVEKLTLNLYEGGITVSKNNFADVEKILFQSYSLPISQNKFSERINPRETMLNRQELERVISMTPEEAKKKYNFNQKDLFNSIYEYWNRYNTPIVCLLLTLLGFTLGVKENRGKGRNSGLWGLGSLIIFYGIFFALVGAARKGSMPMPVAMLIPDLFLLGLGVYFYRKLDWQS
jgi:lipopolysaccharide export system permease protein